jgi:S1-C subfamily serine protease
VNIDKVYIYTLYPLTGAARPTLLLHKVNLRRSKVNAPQACIRIRQFYVLTAAHIVAGAKRVDVNTYSARSHPKPAAVYRAEVLVQADLPDLALLRFATRDEMPGSVPLCPPSRLPEGKEFRALSVGATDGQAPSPRLEDVKGPRRVHRPGADGRVLCWETAQAPAKGRSGGPLLDRRGYAIGLDSGAGDGKGYYVHIEEIHTFLRKNGLEWLSEEKPER